MSAAAVLFALVLGNNAPLPGSGYEPLIYADDDAIRFAELMESIGARTFLLTTPDEETAALHPDIRSRAEPPSRDRLLKVLEDLRREMAAVPNAELYVYFSGHGSVSSSSAHLHLLDGPFTRTDLRELVLKGLSAARAHVIIDSCHSYFLVASRGERVAVTEEETLDRFPEAGFLLSTSNAREVHEWSGYQGGVFTHQILGALQGAADVDGDGVVTYPEAHAYIVAANSGVHDARARIQPFARYPAVKGDVLIDLRSASRAASIDVPEALAGHLHVSDDRGLRLLDAHKPAGQKLRLVLPARPELWLHAGAESWSARGDGPGPRVLQRLDVVAGAEAVRGRGSVADVLRASLFERPLTAEFVAGFEASARAPSQAIVIKTSPNPHWLDDPMTLGLIGAGAAGIIEGVAASLLFVAAANEADRRPITTETELARSRAESWRTAMVLGLAAGTALLGAGILRAIETNGPRAAPNGD